MNATTHPYFIENDAAGSRRETAILLVGTAEEHGIDQREVRTTRTGFRIGQALADALGITDEDDEAGEDDVLTGQVPVAPESDPANPDNPVKAEEPFDPSEGDVDRAKAYVEANPERAKAVLARERETKNRKTLVSWLTEFINSSTNTEE